MLPLDHVYPHCFVTALVGLDLILSACDLDYECEVVIL